MVISPGSASAMITGSWEDIEYTIHEQPVSTENTGLSPKRENPRQVKPEQAKPKHAEPEQAKSGTIKY